MKVLLWSLQGILCAVFLAIGCAKMFLPKEKLLQSMPIYSNVRLSLVRKLGFFELLAASGMVLPALLNIAPFLTTVTAVILAAAMVGAVLAHVTRKEYKQVILPLALFLVATAVALLRLQSF